MDPVWSITKQEQVQLNSLKMKLSVIFGVFHMMVGIVMKAMNSLHFKNKLDFFFEFIPQFVFMFVVFGYMDILIFLKWLTDYTKNPNQAPSIV